MIFCARATRGFRKPSLDAHSGRVCPQGDGHRLTKNADHLGVHAVSVSCRLNQTDYVDMRLQDLIPFILYPVHFELCLRWRDTYSDSTRSRSLAP